jgi:hypothetical protein
MHTFATPESLSPEEQAVIELAARNSGKLEIASRSDTRGPAVRAGRHKLFDPNVPSYAKQCCEAIPRLIELQLLGAVSSQKKFELTNFGWQLSRKLSIIAKNAAQ